MKTAIGIGVLFLVAFATPLFAQGPFADVPTDHWAYEAVNSLQEDGIIIGYPDGTFGGKRAMTRYEFAVAVARAIPILQDMVGRGEPGPQGERGPAGPAGPQGPAGPPGAGAEEVRALQSLVNEFRDELAALGVDVDALKRDLAALAARVDALEKEVQARKWRLGVDLFAAATSQDTGAPFDKDGRPLQTPGPAAGDLINSVVFVRDADLLLTATPTPALTGVADINFGNYLAAYLGGVVTDYTGTERSTAVTGGSDAFTPYYLYAEAGLGPAALAVGRIPVQFTPYTLKLIDVDSYTVNDKLDSGDYPLDGGKLTWRIGGVTLTGFAAKTDENSLLGAGLVSQPTISLYDNVAPTPSGGAPFHAAGGHGIGGLASTTQAAGVRAVIGTPYRGNLGLTWVEAAGPIVGYDTARVLGADGRWQFGRFGLAAEYAQSDTEDDDGVLVDVDSDNTAIDAKLNFGLGKLGIDLGWRAVENNFAGAGYWSKIGMWTNPSNVEGPYLGLTYGLSPSLNIVLNGAFYEGANAVAGLPTVIDDTSDELWTAEVGLKWGLTSTNTVSLGYELVRWSPTGGGDTDEQYISIGFARQLGANTGLSLSYQIIDYDPEGAIVPYGASAYEGAVAVAQLKALF